MFSRYGVQRYIIVLIQKMDLYKTIKIVHKISTSKFSTLPL